MKTYQRLKLQRGISLVEVLVAFLVMGFGMLSLSAMQLTLSRNADVARQRSEAIRLAERHIDKLRSYTSLTTGTINWASLASVTTDTAAQSNTTYTLTTSLGGATSDAMRSASVSVAWTDRTGANQSLSLTSVISQTDPLDIGNVANPLPLNTPLKRPKNRNINIPIPAIDLGNGTSATQITANYVVIFSNISGNVVLVCNPNQANANQAQILASTCESVNGYVVAGYIGRAGNSLAWPTANGINYAGVNRNTIPTTGSYTAIKCLYSDALNQNTNAVITADNGYKYYLCVIPLAAPFDWGGTIRLGGIITTSDRIVCRYQYTQTAVSANARNIQPYVTVTETLDEQNYLLSTSNSNSTSSLTGSTSVCPSAMTMSGVSVGVVHQDCRLANPGRATECPAASP